MQQPGGSASEVEKVLSPPELHLIRLVVCGLRAAARAASASRQSRGSVEAAACRVIARQAGREHDDVLALWWNFRASSLRKLRAHLARGDVAATGERLSALEWAVVDLLMLYDTLLLSVASFHQRAQLAALERTFELVQRFRLEPERGGAVSPEQWRRAADSYCNNGVVLSAVALQRRWYELKLDTRQRACAPRAPGAPRPLLVPIHEAVANRYPHVVHSRELLTWRELVAAGRVAEPTSERGPAPGERRAGAAALTHDAEKSVETIDLLNDEEVENSGHNEAAAPASTSNITPVTTAGKELSGSENTQRNSNRNINQNKNTSSNEGFDKNIDIKIKPEIIEIDDDAPSPKEDIIDAMHDIDLNDVDATIVYESEEEDVKTIIDVQMGDVDKAAESATVVNENNENSNISKENVNFIQYQEVKVESNWSDISNISDEDKKIDIEEHSLVKKEESSDSDEQYVTCSSPDLNKQIEKLRCIKENSENVNIKSEIVNNSFVCNNLDNIAQQLKDEILNKCCDAPLELNEDTSVSDTSQESTEDISGIDPKLLMCPVILLRRIDEPRPIDKLPLPIHRQSNTQKYSKTTYSRLFYEKNKAKLFYERNISRSFYEKNKALLKQCKPCMVPLRRVDEEGGRNVGGNGRKRVRLPDMEKVKRNNRGILTAEVAPLVPMQSATMVKRVRPNPTYSDQFATSSSTLQASGPNPLQYTFQPSVPPPWTLILSQTDTQPDRRRQDPEPSSLSEQLHVGNTYQNSSVINPASQQNYFIIPPTQYNMLQSQDGSLLQNQSSQSQLQNLNAPLQSFMSNPMLQAPNTSWPHGLQQNITNHWPQIQGTENVFTNMCPSVLQTLGTKTTATGIIPTPNISTQNLAIQNISTQNMPTHNISTKNMAIQSISTHNVVAQNILTQNIATQNIPTQNMSTQNILTQNIATQNIPTQNMPTQNISTQNIATENMATQNIATQNIPTQNMSTQNMSTQNTSTQNISTQDIATENMATQNIAAHNISTQNMTMQNIGPQNQTPETQNVTSVDELATGNILTQNTTMQNISTQNIATQNILTHNMAASSISTQNIAMQNIPTQNIETPKILIPNWGLANMAGVIPLTQTSFNQPSLTIDGTLLAQNFQGIVLKQQEPLNQFITGSQPNPFIVNPSCVNTAPTSTLLNPQSTVVTNQALLCGSVLQIMQPAPDGSTSMSQLNQVEDSTNSKILQQNPIGGSSDTSGNMDVDGETKVASDSCLNTKELVDVLQVVPVENLFEMIPTTYTEEVKISYKSSGILDWGLFPLSPSYLMKENKLDFKRVLCTGPGQGWLKGHLVVSDQQRPPPVAAIWSLRPRVRLLLPTSEEDCKDGRAAPNVSFRDRLYQKLFDYPLTYAMMLVAVESAAACRQLLSRGAALQLYCLETGVLHPIQTQRFDNGSLILSGDADVESPLAELTRRLHPAPSAPPPEPSAASAPTAPILSALISAAPRPLSAQLPEAVVTAPMLSALISAARKPPEPKSTFEAGLGSPSSVSSESDERSTLFELSSVSSESDELSSVSFESESAPTPPPLSPNPGPSAVIPSSQPAPEQVTSTPSASVATTSVPTSSTSQIHPAQTEERSTAIRPKLKPKRNETKPVTTVTALIASTLSSAATKITAQNTQTEPTHARRRSKRRPKLKPPAAAKEMTVTALLAAALSSVPTESTADILPANNTQAETKPARRRPKRRPNSKPPASAKEITTVTALVASTPSAATKMTAQLPLANNTQAETRPARRRPRSKPPAPRKVTKLIAPVESTLIDSVPTKSVAEIPPAVKRPKFKPSILKPPTSKSSATKTPAPKQTTTNPMLKTSKPTILKSKPSTPKVAAPTVPISVPAISTAKEENTQCDWSVLSEAEFVANYRLPRRRVRALAKELGPLIQNHCIRKILSCLRYLATDTARPLAGASEVIDALNHHTFINKYITFPLQAKARETVTHRFKQLYKLPNVLGVVDGVQIAIQDVPPAQEEAFLNRAGFHSLNVQLICDADLNILSVDNSQGGCVHDCAIWAAHPLHLQLQRQHDEGERVYLLGDSGYLQRVTLMTPFPTASDPYETLYNFHHSRAWSSIKQCIHMLRQRWRRLTIPLPENKARKIINACAVLHNMAQQCSAPVLPPDVDLKEQERKDALLEEQQESAVVSLVTAPDRDRLLREWKKGVAARNLLVESLKSAIESGVR
ncbi:uncharacterized protein LOC134676760 [Cydia fagiglandana]|uniref:uncharacterized protein LOC134676760 n=1 Tax=Cydia fagiglandana TaxID=1458189 RepID=UPI002FEE0BB2